MICYIITWSSSSGSENENAQRERISREGEQHNKAIAPYEAACNYDPTFLQHLTGVASISRSLPGSTPLYMMPMYLCCFQANFQNVLQKSKKVLKLHIAIEYFR